MVKVWVRIAVMAFMPALAAGANFQLGEKDVFSHIPDNVVLWTEKDVSFSREPNTFCWVSDIEHVIFEKEDGQLIVLADAPDPLYMTGERIPANTNFELFLYHHYGKKEAEQLGAKINYRLFMKNMTDREITVSIGGVGTVTNWDHYKTWEAALSGDGKDTFSLAPYEERTLWQERRLEPDLPWSGIILGKAAGDVWVCNYAYIGEQDPGVGRARPMPDGALAPYYWPSFTRGTADWNAAWIKPFVNARDESGDILLSKVDDGLYSFNFAYSPGGPLTKPCEYKVQEPTFEADQLHVLDGVSRYSHRFFGGNYPIMYHFRLPFFNDVMPGRTKEINFYLGSNDKYKVDSIAGVWINGQMMHCRVPAIVRGEHWRVWSATLTTKIPRSIEFTVVPLGSRWGSLIGTIEVKTVKK
ncbi:MAG TPA: hypothetical protein PLB62_02260 [Candidatus Sumerlaeota bacterium]|nr:hypothetical protein [Candidatus Sumerlaeota bacterium]